MRILLVEDDRRVAAALASALTRRGYEVEHAATVAAALSAAPCDLVLLDLGLPDKDGTEVCRELRGAATSRIIAVTARGEERDRVLGLRPAPTTTWSSRSPWPNCRPGSRRCCAGQPPVDGTGPVVRRRAPHRRVRPPVTVAGRPVALTRKEFDILALAGPPAGRSVTRDRILLDVWEHHLGRHRPPSRCTSARCAASSATPASWRPSAASATGSGASEGQRCAVDW